MRRGKRSHSITQWGQLQSEDRALWVAYMQLLIHSSMGKFWRTWFLFLFPEIFPNRILELLFLWLGRYILRLTMTLLQSWASGRLLLSESLCHSVILDRISLELPHTACCRPVWFTLPPTGLFGSYILVFPQREISNLCLVWLSPFVIPLSPSSLFSPLPLPPCLCLHLFFSLRHTHILVPERPLSPVMGWVVHSFTWDVRAEGKIPQHSSSLLKEMFSFSSNSGSCPSKTHTRFTGWSWVIPHGVKRSLTEANANPLWSLTINVGLNDFPQIKFHENKEFSIKN